jgi:hypothetical protein
MEDNTWNANESKMSVYFEKYPDSPKKIPVMALFACGNETVSERENSWTAITAMCRGMDNSPIGRGRQTEVDAAINTPLLSLTTDSGSVVEQAYITLYETLTNHCGSQIIWGRGGVSYDNGQDFAEHEAKTLYNSLVRALRANAKPKDSDRVLWNAGSKSNPTGFDKNGHITGITLCPKVTEKATEAAE